MGISGLIAGNSLQSVWSGVPKPTGVSGRSDEIKINYNFLIFRKFRKNCSRGFMIYL